MESRGGKPLCKEISLVLDGICRKRDVIMSTIIQREDDFFIPHGSLDRIWGRKLAFAYLFRRTDWEITISLCNSDLAYTLWSLKYQSKEGRLG